MAKSKSGPHRHADRSAPLVLGEHVIDREARLIHQDLVILASIGPENERDHLGLTGAANHAVFVKAVFLADGGPERLGRPLRIQRQTRLPFLHGIECLGRRTKGVFGRTELRNFCQGDSELVRNIFARETWRIRLVLDERGRAATLTIINSLFSGDRLSTIASKTLRSCISTIIMYSSTILIVRGTIFAARPRARASYLVL